MANPYLCDRQRTVGLAVAERKGGMALDKNSARARAGFTLLELLVVLLIVVVAVAFLYPVFAQVRERGRSVVCLSQVSQHARAVLMYAQDYDDRLPVAWNRFSETDSWDESLYPRWWNVIDPYLRDHNVFHCPDDTGYMGMKPNDLFNDRSFFPTSGSSYSSLIGFLPPSENSLDGRFPRMPGGIGGMSLAAIFDQSRAIVSYDGWPYWHALTQALDEDSDLLQLNMSFLDGSARHRSSRYLTTYLVQGPGAANGESKIAAGDRPGTGGDPARISTGESDRQFHPSDGTETIAGGDDEEDDSGDDPTGGWWNGN